MRLLNSIYLQHCNLEMANLKSKFKYCLNTVEYGKKKSLHIRKWKSRRESGYEKSAGRYVPNIMIWEKTKWLNC